MACRITSCEMSCQLSQLCHRLPQRPHCHSCQICHLLPRSLARLISWLASLPCLFFCYFPSPPCAWPSWSFNPCFLIALIIPARLAEKLYTCVKLDNSSIWLAVVNCTSRTFLPSWSRTSGLNLLHCHPMWHMVLVSAEHSHQVSWQLFPSLVQSVQPFALLISSMFWSLWSRFCYPFCHL